MSSTMHDYGSLALGARNRERWAPYGWSSKLHWYHHKPSVLRTDLKVLNGLAILLNVVAPWLLFCVVFALMSFKLRWHHPVICFVIVAFLFGIFVGVSAFFAKMKAKKSLARTMHSSDEDFSENEPMWHWFSCITYCLAIVAAVIVGSVNYGTNMYPLYGLQSLNTYHDVNPALYVGQQLVDAGRLQFSSGVHLDLSRSMGFKDTSIYCVAPIVSPNTTAKTYLDFWAVGKGCCSPASADFHCAGYNSGRYNGGLRLMSDADRPFYRLAVQQAEATYKVFTHKPLFFVWSTNTVEYGEDLQRSGIRMYVGGVLSALVIQCFLVLLTTLVFAKKLMPSR